MKNAIYAGVAGTLFGAGLAVAQMTNPAKVINFLDFAGTWDPSLAFVMGAAVLVSAIAVRVDTSIRETDGALPPPTLSARRWRGTIDARLVGGAALFGAGWGLAGFCPGPAVASLVTGSGNVALFVAAMLVGMGSFELLPKNRPAGAAGSDAHRKPSMETSR